MKKYLLLLTPFMGCAKSQTKYVTTYQKAKVLILKGGESNAGGYGTNANLSTYELSPRRSLKILNNWTLSFDSLRVGQNNLVLHQGIATNGSHGVEVGLANEFDTLGLQVSIVKFGQGGTEIKHWMGTLYQGINPWDTAVKRIDTALKQFTVKPSLVLVWTQGINDTQIPTNSTVWKDSTKLFFQKFRNKYGWNIPIVMYYLPAAFTDYNNQIDILAAEVPNFYIIDSKNDALLNPNHWNEVGFKSIAYKITQCFKSYLQYLL